MSPFIRVEFHEGGLCLKVKVESIVFFVRYMNHRVSFGILGAVRSGGTPADIFEDGPSRLEY